MARRRRIYANPTLGVEPSASEFNELTEDRQLAYNKAAAAHHLALRQANLDRMENASTRTAATEAARISLAKALGHDPNNAPPLAALMARFYSLPPAVQSGIYKQSGAHFMGGTEGVKLISSVAEDRERALDARTNEIGALIATGKIQHDLTPDGKPQFYSIADDETDPLGQKKKKVPLNAMQLSLLDRGFRNGVIPNPFNPDANNGALKAPEKLTDAEYWRRKAATMPDDEGTSRRFAEMYPENAIVPTVAPAQIAANLSGNKTVLPSLAIPPAAQMEADPMIRANQYLRSPALREDIVSGSNIITDTLDGMGRSLVNVATAPARGFAGTVNALGRLVQGNREGEIDYPAPLPVRTADDPRALAIQAELERKRRHYLMPAGY